MKFIDTHAHLYSAVFDVDRDEVLQRSVHQNVGQLYMPNLDVESIEPMLAVEKTYPDVCKAMMGLHPCSVTTDFMQQLYVMEAWLTKRSFVAIGEIGLDFYHDTTYRAQQEEALIIQIKWAEKYGLPVVMHCRNSLLETLHLLEIHAGKDLKGVFHCFHGTLQEAERAIELGFKLGVGGVVTFKNADIGGVLSQVPLQHIVLETDSPYLAPAPYRGQRNEPAHIAYVAAHLAALYGTDLDTVARVTTDNALRLFERDNVL